MRLWSIALSVLLLVVTMHGQDSRGTISGTVLDPAGVPAKSVPVQAKNTTTGVVAKTVTSDAGKYTLSDLAVGTYDVSVAVAGLKAFEAKNISVQSGRTVQLDVRLEEGTQLST